MYTRRMMLKEEYHKNGMSQPGYAPVEYNYMEALAKTYIFPERQNHFIQENIFNIAPRPRKAIAMNSNSASTGSLQRTHSGINSLNSLEYSEEDG